MTTLPANPLYGHVHNSKVELPKFEICAPGPLLRSNNCAHTLFQDLSNACCVSFQLNGESAEILIDTTQVSVKLKRKGKKNCNSGYGSCSNRHGFCFCRAILSLKEGCSGLDLLHSKIRGNNYLRQYYNTQGYSDLLPLCIIILTIGFCLVSQNNQHMHSKICDAKNMQFYDDSHTSS